MDVGHIVVGQQGGNVQVDFRTGVQRRLEIRLLAAAQRIHGAAEQLRVEGKPDFLDLPALDVAQQLARAANFQVVCRQDEPRAEILERVDRLQALGGVGRHRRSRRCEQVSVGAMMRTPDTATQLVQLRKAKAIRPMDDNRVGGRHVDAAFDDRGAQQDAEAAMVEVEHDLLEFPLRHLPVADADARLGNQLLQPLLDAADVFNAVVYEIHLAAALDLAQASLANHDVVPFRHEGFDGEAFRRRRRNQRHLPQAAERHVQGARNRCGR